LVTPEEFTGRASVHPDAFLPGKRLVPGSDTAPSARAAGGRATTTERGPDERIRQIGGRPAPLPGATIYAMPVASAGRRTTAGIPRPSAAPLVRLVRLDLDDCSLAVERGLLTGEERAHADRGTPPVARRRTALRAALRRLAGEVLDLPPADVPLRSGEHGRPELAVPGVDLGCSRTGELGLVAVAVGSRIGLDVEPVRSEQDDALDENWLSPAERSALRALDPSARAVAVTRCWTRKEAVLKGVGSGLTDDLAGLEAGVAPGPVVVAGWRVEPVPVPAGHLASIATLASPFPAAEENAHGRLDP
jgi:4'-phosphopantetheinyl transferase